MSEKTASFAAGCFWGVEARFREVPGVVDAVSGYMGGHAENPTYKQVCTGDTGHAETVQVTYDDDEVDYASLLEVFFDMHNPTTRNRQGPDVGSQYRSAVFWHDAEQKEAAERKIRELDASGKWPQPVVTEVIRAGTFWRAEEYHQRYFEKHGGGYCHV
jgi:peptide-methionine (S)-S-oxide reductase